MLAPMRARAFSLIEMMVVVGILGVLAALALPILTPEVHKAQLNGAAEGVANFLALARAEAMRSKRCTRVLVTPTQLTLQKLNSFHCDVATPTNRIDTSLPVFITLDTLRPESLTNLRYSVAAADGGRLPASPGAEIRFRPNGRVFSNDALTNVPILTNDDAIVAVVHARLPAAANGNSRKILADGNGLICALERGRAPDPAPSGIAGDFSCP
jgi:prepilin-type N-terminal cleavage/methylation domain-containing protein